MNDIDAPLQWEAPGPGEWSLDRSHVNRPATPINQVIQSRSTATGTRRGFAELGAPLDALDFQVPVRLWEAASRAPQPTSGYLPPTGVLAELQDYL